MAAQTRKVRLDFLTSDTTFATDFVAEICPQLISWDTLSTTTAGLTTLRWALWNCWSRFTTTILRNGRRNNKQNECSRSCKTNLRHRKKLPFSKAIGHFEIYSSKNSNESKNDGCNVRVGDVSFQRWTIAKKWLGSILLCIRVRRM